MAGFHHVEIWISDVGVEFADWGWLLERLGFELFQEWPTGQSWRANDAYLSLTTSPNLSADQHDRRRVGVNHIAFRGGTESDVDQIISDAGTRGWRPVSRSLSACGWAGSLRGMAGEQHWL